jgi:hypothetical protein
MNRVTAIEDQSPDETGFNVISSDGVEPIAEGDYTEYEVAANVERRFKSLREAAQNVIDARGKREKAAAIADLQNWMLNTAPAE